MGYTVLFPEPVIDEGRNYLTERGYSIVMGTGLTASHIIEDIKNCDAVLARTASFPREVIEAGKRLKVIARHGVGCDNIDLEAAKEHGVIVTFAPESNANTVAEWSIGALIALARYFFASDRATRTGQWHLRNVLPAIDVEGKTLGIVGAGRIGSRVAKKAKYGLGMNVIVYDPYIEEVNGASDVPIVPKLESLLSQADFVSIHVPLTKATRGMICRKSFELMKESAFLVNAARGEVVNERDLYDALVSRRIAGAAIDVYDPEPPRDDNPLFKLDNIILCPHNAAQTKEGMIRMAVHAAMGIDDVLSGRPPKWPFIKQNWPQ